MQNNYDSDYDVRLATLAAMGGDTSRHYDSVYDIDLAILAIEEQGGGGGSEIDDEHVSTGTTYSSSKIVELTQGLGFDVEVVESLPATGASKTIYLVPKATSGASDIYDEYLYNEGWEKIGNTQIDLSGYVDSATISHIWSGTQAQYDLLEVKLSNTMYLIKES